MKDQNYKVHGTVSITIISDHHLTLLQHYFWLNWQIPGRDQGMGFLCRLKKSNDTTFWKSTNTQLREVLTSEMVSQGHTLSIFDWGVAGRIHWLNWETNLINLVLHLSLPIREKIRSLKTTGIIHSLQFIIIRARKYILEKKDFTGFSTNSLGWLSYQ